MFCPNCGASNPDTATICAQCNQPIPQFSSTPTPPQVQPQPPAAAAPVVPAVPGAPAPRLAEVPNYLVQSIVMTVVTLLCCNILALPFAIIGLVYSTQVNSKLGMNDIAGAQAAAKNAKLFDWISLGVLVGSMLIYFLLMFLGVLGSIWGQH